ncbi:Homeodomain-like protein [Cynara cardunculus var. scolymus]|uniref:Homeodomain-like protein n=1 Tax=Cynara cardunculus var. scolymus TaxID=59895 RepID=A0A118K3G8_CYNCS|nr:Homeodomain-like protein [Cynara cardunculus var. scolymus]
MDVLHEHKCCDGRLVYKGAWTQEEDERLIVYMQSRGDRKQPWKDVPRSAGLARCGKSCRFRWLHYLRPSLNRTEFSTDEIDTIHNLRSSVGNK